MGESQGSASVLGPDVRRRAAGVSSDTQEDMATRVSTQILVQISTECVTDYWCIAQLFSLTRARLEKKDMKL